MNMGECFLDHYERFFAGRMAGRVSFRPSTTDTFLQILVYDRVLAGAKVFATLGLSRLAGELTPYELIAVVDSDWDAVPRVLADVGLELVRRYPKMNWGPAITGLERVDPEFVAKTGKCAAYVTAAHWFGDGFGAFSCGPIQAAVWMLLFVTPDEFAFIRSRGPEAFEERMVDVDLAVLRRPSALDPSE